MKKILCITVVLFAVALVGCKKSTPVASPDAAPSPQAQATAAPDTKVEKPAEKGPSPYKKTSEIFVEFANIAEQNAGNPDDGLKKCTDFVQKNLPQLKSLTDEIKKLEMSGEAVKNMPEIMETNNKIKDVSDKVTKLAQEKYGPKGVDLLMSLSDLAMARL